jgi:hypothetical protein
VWKIVGGSSLHVPRGDPWVFVIAIIIKKNIIKQNVDCPYPSPPLPPFSHSSTSFSGVYTYSSKGTSTLSSVKSSSKIKTADILDK